jgi:hypothetical protein
MEKFKDGQSMAPMLSEDPAVIHKMLAHLNNTAGSSVRSLLAG